MWLKRSWHLLLICPFVIVLSLYVFLLGANYYYARRAAHVLQRIREMKIDNSGIAELKTLGSEHGLVYIGGDAKDCANAGPDTDCLCMVSPNNEWMRSLFRSPTVSRLGEYVGLRAWLAVGDVEIQNGQVVGKVYGLQFYDSRPYPKTEVAAWDQRKIELTPCEYYPVKLHSGYGFVNATNVPSFSVFVSEDASEENRQHAFQFDLRCLAAWHKCERFSEIVPSAWADYEADGEWWKTHRDTTPWQVGTKCPD